MPQKLSSWNALLFSALAYCGTPSGPGNQDAGYKEPEPLSDKCLDALACAEEDFKDECGEFSLYGIFPTKEEALEQCLDKEEIYFYYGPLGDLACASANPKKPVEILIDSCRTNIPSPFTNMDFNKIISYRRVSEQQLGFACRVPCTERATETFAAPANPAAQFRPEEQTYLLRTGIRTDGLELLLALHPSFQGREEPCFRIGYCVVPR